MWRARRSRFSAPTVQVLSVTNEGSGNYLVNFDQSVTITVDPDACVQMYSPSSGGWFFVEMVSQVTSHSIRMSESQADADCTGIVFLPHLTSLSAAMPFPTALPYFAF